MSCAGWEVSSAAIVPAQYQMLCRAIEALEGEGVYISVWIWLLGVRHAGVSHARHEQESQSARVLQWFAARLPSDEHFHSFSAR